MRDIFSPLEIYSQFTYQEKCDQQRSIKVYYEKF